MDKIVELKRELAEKSKEYRTFLDGITEQKRAMTEEERTKAGEMERALDSLMEQVKLVERQMEREKSLPKPPEAQRAQDPNPNPPAAPAVISARSEDLDPGIRLARYVKASLVSQKEGRSFEDVAKNMYPRDMILQESRSAMGTISIADGGALVPDSFLGEIIPLLREQSSIRSLGARTIPMPSGNLKIPRQTGAANFQWVGENKPIIASKAALGMMNLNAKKLAGLIPASTELVNSSAISADMFIRDELVNGIAEAEDITAIYGEGTQDTPAGIIKLSKDNTDLGKLPDSDFLGNIVGAVMAKKFPSKANFGWVFNGAVWAIFYNLKDGVGNYIHRTEMDKGLLLGFPFKINNNIVVGTDAHGLTDIIFGDFSQFIVGETLGLQIAVSQEASYWDGGQLVSSFGNDQIVMRALLREDFGVRYGEAFVVRRKVYTK